MHIFAAFRLSQYTILYIIIILEEQQQNKGLRGQKNIFETLQKLSTLLNNEHSSGSTL